MDKNTQKPLHIDTLRVVYGYAFVITAIDTIPASRKTETDEPSPWLYCPAGRGA